MVWKQDLAQLKNQLKNTEGTSMPPPKPISAPLPPQTLDDADLMFLRAMGGVAVPSAPPDPRSLPTAAVPPTAPEPDVDFGQAIGDLKGLRALSSNPVLKAGPISPSAAPIVVPPLPEPPSIADPDCAANTPDPSPEPPRPKPGPMLIHLAAGMAIEVDGTLDLRRHSLNDARERLKERVRDASALQWRTLLVTFGPNEALKQGFLAFLTTPQAQQFISRYAQAPIPMGGEQAWVLYLNQPPREGGEEA